MDSEAKNGSILVGCSGFRNLRWRGPFYPKETGPAAMLGLYSAELTTVEVRETHHGLLNPETYQRWLDIVPEGFVFSLQVPGYLVQAGGEGLGAARWDDFLHTLEPLRKKNALGALFIQVPESLEQDLNLLEALLEWAGSSKTDLAFDFLHPSWHAPETMDLLGRSGADAAAVNRYGLEPFREVVGRLKYFRLGSPKRKGNYDYPFNELVQWGEQILAAREKADRVYVYFDNPGKGAAPLNARTLVQRILGDRIS